MIIEIPTLEPEEFLKLTKTGVPIIDVRTPAEFMLGHIPGAHNLPLFSNEERALVGTTFKKVGQTEAILEGLSYVGPKMKELAKEAKKIALDGNILIHCWRGGMRSGSVAWLLKTVGMNPRILQGGYKEYRRFSRERFNEKCQLFVIGGMTGSGKTHFLNHIREIGEQVIDLEFLAKHRGSAFGHIGYNEQPSNEHFQNELATIWSELDFTRPIFLEDESSFIGKVSIVDELYLQMGNAPLILLDVDRSIRVQNLIMDYGEFDPILLKECTNKILKKIGGVEAKRICDLIDAKQLNEAAEALLVYYDKTYQYSLQKRDRKIVLDMKIESNPSKEIAHKIIKRAYDFLGDK